MLSPFGKSNLIDVGLLFPLPEPHKLGGQGCVKLGCVIDSVMTEFDIPVLFISAQWELAL